MIELDNVSKYYPTPQGRKYVLRHTSVKFPSKKNIGVFGANGTGKSTLLRLLGRIDYPNEGFVHVTGSMSWPMGLSGGYQGSMTGRENASFICRIYGDSRETIKDKLLFIQAFAELGDYFDMPVKTYSSGMKSRLAFSVSMAFDFDYYLIDELTAVGDAKFRKKSKQALEAKKASANYIFVSHNLNELKQQCDIGVFLNQGRLYVHNNIDDAISAYHEVNQ